MIYLVSRKNSTGKSVLLASFRGDEGLMDALGFIKKEIQRWKKELEFDDYSWSITPVPSNKGNSYEIP